MISRLHINRFIIFGFMVLVALALAYGIKTRSVTGIILSLTSLGAAIHFLILLGKARRELEQEQEEGR
jgi:disulfide bond formation protein DsbB